MKIDYGTTNAVKVKHKLDILLRDVSIKIPQAMFQAVTTGHLDGVVVCTSVDVFSGPHHMGTIGLKYKTREGKDVETYYIKSEHIQKLRGHHRNVRETISFKEALKCALTFFKVQPEDARVKDMRDIMGAHITIAYDSASHNLSRSVKNNTMLHPMLEYCIGVIDNPCDATPMPARLSTDIMSIRQHVDNYRIMQSVRESFKSNRGAIVRLERDGSLTKIELRAIKDEPTIKSMSSTYDLPPYYQEKLAMLKICQPQQPVDNVGIKFAKEVRGVVVTDFFLVEGDTVTTC